MFCPAGVVVGTRVAEQGFASHLRRKAARGRTGNPIDDLRTGWDLHTSVLTSPENALMTEWLDRVIAAGSRSALSTAPR